MKKFVYPMLSFVLAAGGACAAQSDQPSLGDLAKQNRQEKKVVKVLTNDDVATATPQIQSQDSKTANMTSTAPDTSSGAEASAKGPAKAKETEKADAAPKDPPAVAELKQKLTSYKREQEGWKRSAKKYEDLLSSETSDFRRQVYEEALEGDKRNVEIYQEKIDQAQSDLSKAEKSSSSSN